MELKEVCMFGDSVARGIVLDEHGSYTPIKDSFAEEAAQRLGIGLVNKARFGCTITKGLRIVRDFLTHSLGNKHEALTGDSAQIPQTAQYSQRPEDSQSEPQVALLEFGGNDCNFDWPAIAAEPRKDYEPATPVGVFRQVYGEVILSLRDQGYVPVLLTLPPLDAERYFEWFTRGGLDKDAVLFWLGDVQFIYRWHEGYNDIVWDVAMNYNCPVIDIRANFLQHKNVSSLLCMDGIHPNRAGHRLIEDAILNYAAAKLSA